MKNDDFTDLEKTIESLKEEIAALKLQLEIAAKIGSVLAEKTRPDRYYFRDLPSEWEVVG